MRLTTFSFGFRKRLAITLVMAVVFIPSAGAYINGGIHHSTLKTYEKQLRAAGWAMDSSRELQADLSDKSTLSDSVNKLVAKAIRALPKEDAAKVSPETKHEIARIAKETIEKAVTSGQDLVKSGQTGSLRYHVGTLWNESYWVTEGRRGQSKVEGRSSYRAPFVALTTIERTQAEARITVLVPADAEIFFDNEATTQTGTERLYVTPLLRVGKNYQYEVIARWQENGKEVRRSRKVTITSGDSVRVNFLTGE